MNIKSGPLIKSRLTAAASPIGDSADSERAAPFLDEVITVRRMLIGPVRMVAGNAEARGGRRGGEGRSACARAHDIAVGFGTVKRGGKAVQTYNDDVYRSTIEKGGYCT